MARTKKRIHKKRKSRRYKRKQKGGNLIGKKILICYATRGDSYEEGQKKLVESAKTIGGIDEVIALGPDDLSDDFKNTYKQFFDHKRGGGYWIWKPYIILNQLHKINDNDILIYIDSDKSFLTSIDTYLNNFNANKSIMVFQLSDGFLEKYWTKMDIFKRLQCENNKDITDTPQIESGYAIFRKNQDSFNLLNKWNELNKEFNLVSDIPSVEPNFEGFFENRHDQSLFSCLCKINKDNYNIQIEKTPTDYGNPKRSEGFPQLLKF
uniref:Nucleotide-diphospho-sugar transferase domain-containing protein n=1 Tax=viral metagenome TaxID=1070528 RepID=A0A6C0D6K1_9ZZZZ